MANHYVNNADFLAAIKDYRAAIVEAEEAGDPRPRVPEYIGECILKIANRLSHKANFINYSYREDMVLDGIENCMQCIHKFDPDKSSNPFSYFTQVIYFAFLRRIAKEKKQTYIKGKMIQESAFDALSVHEMNEDEEFKNSYIEFMQQHQVLDDSFLKKKEPVAKKKKESSLENFFETSDDIESDDEEITDEFYVPLDLDLDIDIDEEDDQ